MYYQSFDHKSCTRPFCKKSCYTTQIVDKLKKNLSIFEAEIEICKTWRGLGHDTRGIDDLDWPYVINKI